MRRCDKPKKSMIKLAYKNMIHLIFLRLSGSFSIQYLALFISINLHIGQYVAQINSLLKIFSKKTFFI